MTAGPPPPGERPPAPVASKWLAVGVIGVMALWIAQGALMRATRPPRPAWLPPPVRAPQGAAEEAFRAEIETGAALWTGRRGSEVPPPAKTGPEPRPGVSALEVCNRTGADLALYLDGVEMLRVPVPAGASVAVEVKSGEYDLIATGAERRPMMERLKLEGVYHALLYVDATKGEARCPGAHEMVRTVK